jgi:hypothetical protein
MPFTTGLQPQGGGACSRKVALLKHPAERLVTMPSDQVPKDERLLVWRLQRFAELGFSAAESSELAESEADHHLAAALVAAGCPLELLRQIVL